ncbi:MAG: diguanylate cyclase [Ketobacter sp.]
MKTITTGFITNDTAGAGCKRGLAVVLFCVLQLSCLMVVAGSVNAQTSLDGKVVDLTNMEARQRIQLNAHLAYFEDTDDLGIDDLLAEPYEWSINQSGLRNFGQSSNPYWFKVTLDNLDQAGAPLYVRFAYPHVDLLDVFWVHDNAVIKRYRLGDSVAFNERPVDNRVYLLPLEGLAAPRVTLYLKVVSQGPMEVPLDVLTYSKFYELDKAELIWYGAYFGVMLVMFFYNFFIFVLVRDITYFYYLFYVASTVVLQFTLTGASFQLLWPLSPALNNTMVLTFTSMMPLAAIFFVRSFLQLETTAKPLVRWLARVLVTAFFLQLLLSFVLPYALVLKIAHALSFTAVSFGLYLGVTYWFRGVRAARTFALAWLVYLIFILIYLLQITSTTQPNIVSIHALEIGSMLELVLLSLSFGHRINEEKEMRIRAQDQALKAQSALNRNLDQLVRRRTDELEQANARLKELSIKDGLTGIFNRRHFEELAQTEYQRSFRDKNWLSIAMLDVDHFKGLNDRYGHPFGDLCLKKIATVIMGQVRRPPDMVARYGGEEFIVLLPGTSVEGGNVVAENMRRAVEGICLQHEGAEVRLSVSIGVAGTLPSQRDDLESLIKAADDNLYKAKKSGRNCVVCSSAGGA